MMVITISHREEISNTVGFDMMNQFMIGYDMKQ